MIDIMSIPIAYSFGDYEDGNSFFDMTRYIRDVRYFGIVNKLKRNPPNNVNVIELKKSNRISFVLSLFREAKKIAHKNKVMIQHPLVPFYLYNIVPSIKDIPLILTVEVPHGNLRYINKHLGKLSNSIRFPLKYVSQVLLEEASLVVAVNEGVKDFYSNYVDRRKLRIIPYGIDTKKIYYKSLKHNHHILVIGSATKRKGIEYLIKSLPDIIKEYPRTKLCIVGKGNKERYEKMTKQLDVMSNTVFCGSVSYPTLLNLYRDCMVFCHPSLGEGFTFPILEAMGTGRAVVATNTNGSQMVEHGKTGFLVPPADSDALADAILKIFSDNKLVHKMGIEGRRKVEREYDWNIVAKKYYEVYREVL